MYSIEEAKAELDAKQGGNKDLEEDDDRVIHQVVSMKKMTKQVNRRGSSFFMKKMMSFKSRAKVGVDSHDVSSSSDEDSDEDNNDDKSDDEGENKGALGEYVDPPMPMIGHPVKIDLLVSRNHKAESGLKILMQMVAKDVQDSVNEVSHIPVSDETDRIQVSIEAAARMARVRSAKDIDKRVQTSVKDIQKALNYRKSALIMMNSNYSKHQVRKIEPIYVNETRSIIQHHTDS